MSRFKKLTFPAIAGLIVGIGVQFVSFSFFPHELPVYGPLVPHGSPVYKLWKMFKSVVSGWLIFSVFGLAMCLKDER